jgi:hypothetical protein
MRRLHASFAPPAIVFTLSATLVMSGVAAGARSPALPGVPDREVQRIAAAARTADLRGQWDGLVRSHAALEAKAAQGANRAWIDYYLGYIDWRQSSLAYMGEGIPGTTSLLWHAREHLTRAVDAAPGFTEALALLVIVDGFTLGADPQHAADVGPRFRANVRTLSAHVSASPRVRLIRAMLAYFPPGNSRVGKDAALVSWRQAAESFPPRPALGEPEWGKAEAWAWLGGALLADGNPAAAREALERAIADRKDFWWVRDIALPQAARSRLSHSSERHDGGAGDGPLQDAAAAGSLWRVVTPCCRRPAP